jgi:hypothetical protein
MKVFSPSRAACEATALARMPVDDYAIFEAKRRQANGVILDEEIVSADVLTQTGSLHQRGKPHWSLRHVTVGYRQQRAIAPHIQRSLLNGFAGKSGAGVLEVEDYLERRKTLVTDGKRLNPVGPATFTTAQIISNRHSSLAMYERDCGYTST